MTGTMDTNPLPDSGPERERTSPNRVPETNSAATPPAFSEGPQSSLLRKLFFGREGLYPGYRWLIYLAMGVAILMVLLVGIRVIHPQHGGPVWWQMVGEACMMLAAFAPAFVMTRLEGVSFGTFGLPSREAFGRNFWAGTLWGIAWLAVLMIVLRLVGVFSFGTLAEHGGRIVKFAVYYAIFFLMTGFFEEFLWRGYSQWVLTKGMHFWPAAVLLSLTFAGVHAGNSGEAKAGLVAVFCMGMFFCFTLRRTGTLWWAVGFHMSWDWGESFLYSVPDSGTVATGHLLNSSFHGPAWLTGGTVGPEGSYLVFGLLVALWVAFDRMYPEVKYGVAG